MNQQRVQSHDGFTLTYGYSEHAVDRPWVVLIIPFGLKVELARPFFDFLSTDHNVLSWESRLILDPPEQRVGTDDLTVDKHVADLMTVLDSRGISRTRIVGYCSGAGIALAALKAHPDRFSDVVLVSGEYVMLRDASCVTQFGSDIDSILPMASKDSKTAQFILDRIQLDATRRGPRAPDGINLPFSSVHYFHRYAMNYLSYRAANFAEMARSLNKRTLVIAGQCDQQTNVASSQKIQQLIAGSSLLIEPEGDHYELLRAGSNTMVAIREFLNVECANG